MFGWRHGFLRNYRLAYDGFFVSLAEMKYHTRVFRFVLMIHFSVKEVFNLHNLLTGWEGSGLSHVNILGECYWKLDVARAHEKNSSYLKYGW